jgi:hypothetical protein
MGTGFCRLAFQALPSFTGSEAEVWTRIGTRARSGCALIRRHSSAPPIRGIIQSVMTRSGTLLYTFKCLRPVTCATHVISLATQYQMPHHEKVGLVVDQQK